MCPLSLAAAGPGSSERLNWMTEAVQTRALRTFGGKVRAAGESDAVARIRPASRAGEDCRRTKRQRGGRTRDRRSMPRVAVAYGASGKNQPTNHAAALAAVTRIAAGELIKRRTNP